MRPVLEMVPSRSYRIGARLVSRKPRQMVLLGQNWSGDLDPTDAVDDLYYTPRFRIFDTDGNFQWMEVLAVEIRVPVTGGSLGTFPNADMSPSSTWIADTAPPAGFKGWWLHPITGDLRPVY
ncbi:hypothetical protein [Pseudoclavibacter sp. VKM Ac-2888]|uniref:hypothetical protein n=1 Tax=Pseudoclavibacter sp. VKM Ac-2888 TaxID=2783830 RepID=UPI00188AFAA6|nr:hypothetical protein [Pseudoclavibacter sp. VKM Ac-2888]MBF4549663.1 hypothetical protein [Pseudoclavibacter sp. VKM Ac-2888]